MQQPSSSITPSGIVPRRTSHPINTDDEIHDESAADFTVSEPDEALLLEKVADALQPPSSIPSSPVPRRASTYLKRKLISTNTDSTQRKSTSAVASKKRYADRSRDTDVVDDQLLQAPLSNTWGSDDDDDDDDDEDLLFGGDTVELSNGKQKWITTPPPPSTKRRRADIMKERPGPQGLAKRAKDAISAFLLFITMKMIQLIVEATNYEIHRIRKMDDVTPLHADTCVEEIRCLIGIFLFRGLNHDVKNGTDELWYDNEVSRALYRASMTRDRFQFLLRCFSFHTQASLRQNIVTDAYAKVREFLTAFENNARLHYKHTELVCLDETLRNFFAHECDLRVFMPDKPGQMGLFYYTLADGIDRYFSRIIPKTKAAVSMSPKEAVQKTYDLVMEITSDIHYTGRNLTADRGFSSLPIALDLYQRDVTYVGTIKKNMSGLPSAAKKL